MFCCCVTLCVLCIMLCCVLMCGQHWLIATTALLCCVSLSVSVCVCLSANAYTLHTLVLCVSSALGVLCVCKVQVLALRHEGLPLEYAGTITYLFNWQVITSLHFSALTLQCIKVFAPTYYCLLSPRPFAYTTTSPCLSVVPYRTTHYTTPATALPLYLVLLGVVQCVVCASLCCCCYVLCIIVCCVLCVLLLCLSLSVLSSLAVPPRLPCPPSAPALVVVCGHALPRLLILLNNLIRLRASHSSFFSLGLCGHALTLT